MKNNKNKNHPIHSRILIPIPPLTCRVPIVEPCRVPIVEPCRDTALRLDVTDHVTDHVTDLQQKILEAIRQNPSITQSSIAERIGISRVHVSRNMRVLQERGIIRRVGSDRSGYWEIQ